MKKVVNRKVKSFDVNLPAPVGGLNKRDPLIVMAESDAIKMDNYIPTINSVELREGYQKHCSLGTFSNTSKVETLCAYHTSEHSKLIAVFGGKAYDVSLALSVEYQNVSFSKSRCQTVMYKNRLFFLNGVDMPKVYYIDDENVQHFENWGFSGENLQALKIINAGVSHEFLWFVEKNSTRAWVSTVGGNVAGTLSAFDTADVLKWGGKLVSVFNWTVDGGQGIDDYTCLLTSEGEVLVYKGYNPNDADNFELIGSYKLSKPIGYQCVTAYQGDVVIITEEGYLPLSKALSLNNAGFSAVAFSNKINGLVQERTTSYKNEEGWQGLIYGKKGYGIFNVPIGNAFEQHVINISTGAWCRWTNIRAFCWCLYNGELYFGSDNNVFKFGGTYADDGLPIEGQIEQAYSNLKTDGLKKVVLLKPKIRSSQDFKLMIWTNMDFDDSPKDFYVTVGSANTDSAKWGVAQWNEAMWYSTKTRKMQGQWLLNAATGFKASVVFKTTTKGNLIEWFETGVRVETGTGLI